MWDTHEAVLAQCWEHLPSFIVALSWFPASSLGVGLVCLDLSSVLRGFSRVFRFSPLTENQKFDLIKWDLVWFVVSSIIKATLIG